MIHDSEEKSSASVELENADSTNKNDHYSCAPYCNNSKEEREEKDKEGS
jgi:hypothetical protein